MTVKKKRKAAEEAPESFDEGMKSLESLVGDLESGELPLEAALESFEKGVGLVRSLNERLNEAEKKIEILSRAADGGLVTQDARDLEDPDEGAG